MREIRFKAKMKDNGEWIEGYLFNNGYDGEEEKFFVGYIIIDEYVGTADDEWDITGIDFAEIIPETVCQYTGLKDKDGQDIWENDILDDWNGGTSVVKFGKFEIEDEHDCSTTEINGWYVDFINTNYASELSNAEIRFNHFLVVGNIFDNPDLIESR